MTDVESKTPTKRKSLPANHASGKKVKLDKSLGNKPKTPGKNPSRQQNGEKIGQNKKTPKQDSQNNSRKKQKGKAPKKIKAFSGTAAIENPKTKNIKQNRDQDKESGENVVKKKRRSQFHQIKTKARAGDKAVVQSIEDKIKTIESRGSPTKTAVRKLKLLKRLKRLAEGKPAETQNRAPHQKSDSTKRRERKKNLKSKQNEPTVKPKQSKVQKNVEAEEESDDDDNADNSEEEVKNADSSNEEEGSEEDAESDDEVEGSEDEAGSGDEEEGSEDEENSDDEDDEFEEESVPQENVYQPGKKKLQLNKADILKTSTHLQANVGSDVLQKNNSNTKIQKRYVLFIGNIPYDTNKMQLKQHFEKCGDVINVRIPTEKKTKKPRGFAFIEVGTEKSYQKCLSLHHSILKGRKINVLYTLGGKNNEERMRKIKAKNFKLHAMRKKGQLVGSKKESQTRSFRRKKHVNNNSKIQ